MRLRNPRNSSAVALDPKPKTPNGPSQADVFVPAEGSKRARSEVEGQKIPETPKGLGFRVQVLGLGVLGFGLGEVRISVRV